MKITTFTFKNTGTGETVTVKLPSAIDTDAPDFFAQYAKEGEKALGHAKYYFENILAETEPAVVCVGTN